MIKVKKIVIVLLGCCCLFCGLNLLKINFQEERYNQLQQYVINLKNQSLRSPEIASDLDCDVPSLSPLEINSDYLSMVSVGEINELVVLGDEYYLTHDFNKHYSIYGTPFMFPDNNIDDSVLVIYGHSSSDGLVFSQLKNWLDSDYFNQDGHRLLNFLDADYEVVIAGKSNFTEAIPYYSIPEESEFKSWLEAQKKQGLVVADFDIENVDQAVVLSTCDMTKTNKRIYLIAVK